ncbi:MAG: YkgJ family cysteine cluster protein [Lachnospiraceae bacterium]|nr:YkgJ family cysteine cluster protein [Lachnospiraceae bacterium]
MKRNVDMKEISDGRLYTASDMVKADTGGCQGCSVCCHGMGNSIILDPYDGYRLTKECKVSMEELLSKNIELNMVDGLILPNLKMAGDQEACSFLNERGRCSIHSARPGICRLFPLGRYYEGREFRYFLQIHECPKAGRTKVKVKKWLDTPDLGRYEEYIRSWHGFLEDVQHLLDGSEQRNAAEEGDNGGLRRQLCMYLLKQFFLKPWDIGQDFYPQYEQRLEDGRKLCSLPI